MLRWLLRRFRFVQDLELDVQVLQRAFESADRYAGQLESLKVSQEHRIKDLVAENNELRSKNTRLLEAQERHD